jgi:hypothetical protein
MRRRLLNLQKTKIILKTINVSSFRLRMIGSNSETSSREFMPQKRQIAEAINESSEYPGLA